ncbi:SixA phosphatase family protein [Ornithinimicrobium avium]|uniref:Histidine phosphatase family protein n=1 Tax=Ornithinimicrobium avium TaxID=2283195 RepID=A0A345NM16_9MICO|nr:histidine phosphatase family protein [Ornithinimicrobium avium]AXH96074.1 histidine phosphatase family protein [Ornithinimicrobium avium]
MTRTLVIVRHAKTEREHRDGDHERELVLRGVADATVLGRWLAEQELLPDLVLVSTAARARQTAEHVLEGAGAADAQRWPGRDLYDRGVRGALGAVREAPEDAATVWVVGHQPTMGTLALALTDRRTSDRAALSILEDGFPTASAAVLRTEVAWDLLQSGLGSLVAFHTARA